MNTDSCEMTLQPDDDAVIDGPVGSYCFTDTEAGRVMWLKLPDDAASAINIRPHNTPGPSWEWDGNMSAPTLSPSVHRIGSWHGWVKAGRMESC